jgi:hypothetical protein
LEELRNTYKIVYRKSEGWILLAGPSDRWEHNIKMNFNKIECQEVDCIYVIQGKVQ